jgi:hypothetical protein
MMLARETAGSWYGIRLLAAGLLAMAKRSTNCRLGNKDMLWDVFVRPSSLWAKDHLVAEPIDERPAGPRCMFATRRARGSQRGKTGAPPMILERLVRHAYGPCYGSKGFAGRQPSLCLRVVDHFATDNSMSKTGAQC